MLKKRKPRFPAGLSQFERFLYLCRNYKFIFMAKVNILGESVGKADASQVVKVFENPEFGKVRTVVINDEPWFVGNDVAKVLEYANPKDAVKRIVDDEDRRVVQLSDVQEELPVYMKNFKIAVIDKRGLSSLIFKSNKLSMDRKIYLAGIFDIPISFFSRREIEFKDELVDFFKAMGLFVESQYKVGKYIVDFYIPHLNLIIEYDEKEHKLYDTDLERKRESFIINKLKCRMIRLSDRNSNAYNLGLITKEMFVNKQDFKVKPCYR